MAGNSNEEDENIFRKDDPDEGDFQALNEEKFEMLRMFKKMTIYLRSLWRKKG